MNDISCECCNRKCKLKHKLSERVKAEPRDIESRRLGVMDLVCPSCGHRNYYRLDEKNAESAFNAVTP